MALRSMANVLHSIIFLRGRFLKTIPAATLHREQNSTRDAPVPTGRRGSWGNLEYGTAAVVSVFVGAGAGVVRAAEQGCPVKISVPVQDHSCFGIRAIGAVSTRAEGIEGYLLTFWGELEYDAASVNTAGVVSSAEVCRSVQVSLLVED